VILQNSLLPYWLGKFGLVMQFSDVTTQGPSATCQPPLTNVLVVDTMLVLASMLVDVVTGSCSVVVIVTVLAVVTVVIIDTVLAVVTVVVIVTVLVLVSVAMLVLVSVLVDVVAVVVIVAVLGWTGLSGHNLQPLLVTE